MALWTPANLAVPPRIWRSSSTANLPVFSGTTLTSWANSGSEAGTASVSGSPQKATLNGINGVALTGSAVVSQVCGLWGTSGVQFTFSVLRPGSVAGNEGLVHVGSPTAISGLTINCGVELYCASQGFVLGPILAKSTGAGLAVGVPAALELLVGTGQTGWLTGTAITGFDGDTTAGTFPNIAGTYVIGEGWDPVSLTGDLFEFLNLDYVPVTLDRQRLEGWAAWAYGFEADLPSGHPFEFAPPTTDITVSPARGSLTVAGFAPAIGVPVNLAPARGSLALTGFAPVITYGAGLAPGRADLLLTGFAPSITFDAAFTVGLGTQTLTGFAPTITAPVNVTVSPGVGGQTLTGFAPDLTYGASITPARGELALTGYAPTITYGAGLAPGRADLFLTGFAPTISSVGGTVTVSPATGQLTLTGFAPGIRNGQDSSMSLKMWIGRDYGDCC